MKNPNSCPYCGSEIGKRAIHVEERIYLFCYECGVVFQELEELAHKRLAGSIYSTTSWGQDREQSIALHGPRLTKILDWYDAQEVLNPNNHYLDVGAGVGVLEHALEVRFGHEKLFLSAIEPVEELAKLLQQHYPAINVITGDVEGLVPDPSQDRYDGIFCFGVDYLFRDLEGGLKSLRLLVKDGGRLMISRNVFLDMACYWGGKPILSFTDLVKPNPLISLFMYKDQYIELLQRELEIRAYSSANETYKRGLYKGYSTLKGKHLVVDCLINDSYSRRSDPVRNPSRAMSRLNDLGVPL